MKDIHFKIDNKIHRRFKVISAKEERSITEIMKILIEDFVKTKENEYKIFGDET